MGNVAQQDILSCGSNVIDRDAHIGYCRGYGLCHGVGNAAL
ncbi:hypothetical protein ES703_41494 [subsurface metagenome]